MAHPLPDRHSIAVLPFVNLSTDKSRDFIVDGITEDIISALARFKDIFVIASNSTLTYKGKAVKVHQVAEELGVRYVLEGSAQISQDRVRVTAQLIDAIAGTHLWVEQFDRPLKDVFWVRDEVTRKIIGSLGGKLYQEEMARASLKHPDSLDAYGLYWQAFEILMHFTPTDNAKAREICEKAIALDRKYDPPYRLLAWTHYYDWQYGWLPGKSKESYQKAMDLIYKAVALDPGDGLTRASLAYFLLRGRKFDEARAEFEEALKTNPNDVRILVLASEFYGWTGQPKEAIHRIQEAMRLNPNYPNWYLYSLGFCQYVAHDYQGAVETLRKMSPMGVARGLLAASLAQLGRMEEARAEAEKCLKENPSYSATYVGSTSPFLHDKDRQHVVEGLIKAGLPR